MHGFREFEISSGVDVDEHKRVVSHEIYLVYVRQIAFSRLQHIFDKRAARGDRKFFVRALERFKGFDAELFQKRFFGVVERKRPVKICFGTFQSPGRDAVQQNSVAF